MGFDVIGLLALPMTLGSGTCELVCGGEDDFFAGSCLDQTVVDALCHWAGARILALFDVLASRLLESPDYRFWRRGFERVGDGVDTVSMHRDDYEIVLLLCLFGDRETEDLVYVLPGYGKLDVAACADCPDAAILFVEQLEGELLALGNREADAGI